MGIVMGVMIVLMVAALIGFGHHGGMMGGHDKEGQKEEIVTEEQTRGPVHTDGPVEMDQQKENSKPEGSSNGQYRD